MDLVCAVHKTVKDCVGEGRVADVLVPVLDRELAGEERGSGADAIVQQFEQIGAFARSDGGDRKVIDHHEVHLGDGGQALAEAAIGVTEAQFIEQARGAQVERGQALAASLMGQCAAQKRLATAGCTVDEKILVLTDPVAGTQARQLRPVKTAASAEIEVFKGSALLELCELQQTREPPVLAVGDLALDQQAEAIFEGQALGAGLGHLLAQRGGHTVELQLVQCIEGGLGKDGSGSPVSVVVVKRKYSGPRRLAWTLFGGT